MSALAHRMYRAENARNLTRSLTSDILMLAPRIIAAGAYGRETEATTAVAEMTKRLQ